MKIQVLIVVGLCCLSGCNRESDFPKWEYTLLDYGSNGSQMKILNELGSEGWEVSLIVPNENGSGGVLLLKRRPLGK